MNTRVATRIIALLISVIALRNSSALAQEQPTSGSVVPAPSAQPAASSAGGTDHDRVINQWALRYFGQVSAGGPGGAAPTVHNIGVRYWLSRAIGVEAGVGLAFSTRSTMGGSNTEFGFGITGGLPINLAATQHLAIHVIPNVTFGMPTVDPLVTVLSLGADAAAELHFGFINVPQMSLQARFGLNVNLLAGGGVTQFGFGTTAGQGSNVWDVIAASIAATYYFGR
jgi:hypothetical protein